MAGSAEDERACTSGRAASAPNLAGSAPVASAFSFATSAFAASDFAALAAPSCFLAGSGSGFIGFDLAASTSSTAAFAALTASASRHLSSFSEAMALTFAFALAAAACLALACSFAAAAILAARAAASGNTVVSAMSADFATVSAFLRPAVRRQVAGTQELRHGVIGAQAGWRDVPGQTAPASRSCEQPLRRERLRSASCKGGAMRIQHGGVGSPLLLEGRSTPCAPRSAR
eukprot:scaffold61263_cov45-Phaeocystis_antarctica.AAC.1